MSAEPTSRAPEAEAGAPPATGTVEVHPHRLSGAILSGLGAFLLLAGLMVHFYAVPKLSIAPIDQNSVTSLEAKGATLFDTSTLKPLTTDLSVKARTVGDVAASKKAPGDTLVWVNTTTITSSDGVIRSQSAERTPFNGTTAEAVNCCGAFSESEQGQREEVQRTGLVFKFPFGTDKLTYQVWDDTLGEAVATKYVGTAKRAGLAVYRFESDVPPSTVGTTDAPASVLGLPGTGNITADNWYQNHITYYVEPVTGAIVDQVQQQRTWLAAEGQELTTLDGTIAYTSAQVKKMVDQVDGKATLLSVAEGFVPWLAVGLGALLLGLGVVRSRRTA
jgi:hypothetical protein